MFLTQKAKKNKIIKYLEGKKEKSVFDELLTQWLNHNLEENLSDIGLRKLDIHVDWFDDYKCIAIQARKEEYFVEMQIHSSEFTIAYDVDEADDDTEYPLISVEDFYENVRKNLEPKLKTLYELEREPGVSPDILANITLTRKMPVYSGYRPAHLIGDYYTTGVQKYSNTDVLSCGETVEGTVTFLTPRFYPNSLEIGMKLYFYEGERCTGYVEVLEIYNELLKK